MELFYEREQMKSPKVSVVMPVFETPENMLRPAIESILNQSFKDFEFIILNDGSSDKNIDSVIQSYHDERIVYVSSKENKGLIYQLNKGIELARGEYIARMDSDDISLPERFEKQVAYMDAHPETGVLGSWAETFPSKNLWTPPARFGILELLKWNPWLIHPSMMLRTSVIRENGLSYEKDFPVAEDYGLWWRMIRVSEIHNIQEVLLHYRYGEGQNISVRKAQESLLSTKKIQTEILHFLTSDVALQNSIQALLYGNYCHKKKLKRRIKYILYKTLWVLGGKGEFFKEKMQRTKKKLKGKI